MLGMGMMQEKAGRVREEVVAGVEAGARAVPRNCRQRTKVRAGPRAKGRKVSVRLFRRMG